MDEIFNRGASLFSISRKTISAILFESFFIAELDKRT